MDSLFPAAGYDDSSPIDPKEAMEIATKMAEIFKDERQKRELSGARGGLVFSDEQMNTYKASLEEAEQRKAEFESEYRSLRGTLLIYTGVRRASKPRIFK